MSWTISLPPGQIGLIFLVLFVYGAHTQPLPDRLICDQNSMTFYISNVNATEYAGSPYAQGFLNQTAECGYHGVSFPVKNSVDIKDFFFNISNAYLEDNQCGVYFTDNDPATPNYYRVVVVVPKRADNMLTGGDYIVSAECRWGDNVTLPLDPGIVHAIPDPTDAGIMNTPANPIIDGLIVNSSQAQVSVAHIGQALAIKFFIVNVGYWNTMVVEDMNTFDANHTNSKVTFFDEECATDTAWDDFAVRMPRGLPHEQFIDFEMFSFREGGYVGFNMQVKICHWKVGSSCVYNATKCPRYDNDVDYSGLEDTPVVRRSVEEIKEEGQCEDEQIVELEVIIDSDLDRQVGQDEANNIEKVPASPPKESEDFKNWAVAVLVLSLLLSISCIAMSYSCYKCFGAFFCCRQPNEGGALVVNDKAEQCGSPLPSLPSYATKPTQTVSQHRFQIFNKRMSMSEWDREPRR